MSTAPDLAAGDGSVVELIGNPRAGSRTRTLADAVTRAVLARLGDDPAGFGDAPVATPAATTPTVLELGELVGVTFTAEPATGSGEIADPFALVRGAKLLVVATPTYKGTYTGLLKIFLDQFWQGQLAGAVAIPVAIAASPDHQRSVAESLQALLVELGAVVPVAPLSVLEPQLDDLDGVVGAWLEDAAGPVAAALRERAESARAAAQEAAAQPEPAGQA